MRIVVPFASERPKTRLAAVLEPDERAAFARAMLADVLAAVRAAGHDPEVLATGPVDCSAPVTVDERPLTDVVNDVLPDSHEAAVAVVMADLPLVTGDALTRLFEPDRDVVLAPGRGGGTNALVARDPAFRVDYHGASIRDHRRIAREAGLTLATVDSRRLSTDVDEPADLVEVLLHADGAAREWLREAGFALATDEGRVDVRRTRE
jgi:2-phospho-L-lactate guanylyltransferase